MSAHRIFAAFALLAAFGTAHATRVLEQPERPYELSLARITLPSSNTGGVSVKRCDDCAYSTHVLTPQTRFIVNGQSLPFAEFNRIVGELRDDERAADRAFVGVFVDVSTGRVNRITLRHRGL